ncbi:MAG: excinuclease ABC subunit UvrC [Christensenellaceae bacterium]|jgi:excinuclease ABC subunit C|nr:excinuclease ABC subunit UvrC [Christensenellaceae bacterium]
MKDFSEKLKVIPSSSGVYIMLDAHDQILYVGKAKNLKNRIRQYFQNSVSQTEKTMILVEKISDFRYIITNSEIEALILENNLIKEHKPFYNILLKDDKSYPYIKINLKANFPILEITRKLKDDGSKYFGPYMLGINPNMILDILHSVFPIRSCNIELPAKHPKDRECLNYHIGKCLAPCTNRISKSEYADIVKNIISFLNGDDKEIRHSLMSKIKSASEKEEFEIALQYRDQLRALDKLIRKQNINFPKEFSLDVFAYATNGMFGVINYLVVRGGKIIGAQNYQVSEAGSDQDILSSYIMQFYQKNPMIASDIIISSKLIFESELKSYLSEKKGSKVNIIVPQRGNMHQLLEMAYANAKEHLSSTISAISVKEAMTRTAVERLKFALNLPFPPKRMECFDISHISGTDKVASMVVFINGEASNKMYRRFKIKTVIGNDDFACMKEVLSRRLNRLTSTDESFSDFPDLIIVDGGKGQLSSAYSVVEPTGIHLIGLAKREEEVFFPNNSTPLILPKGSLELSLLQRIRDESHRFAITYHRVLRKKHQTRSDLLNIPGIGAKKARTLLIYFKNIESIAKASIDDLMNVDGFGKTHAQSVYDYFLSIRNDVFYHD